MGTFLKSVCLFGEGILIEAWCILKMTFFLLGIHRGYWFGRFWTSNSCSNFPCWHIFPPRFPTKRKKYSNFQWENKNTIFIRWPNQKYTVMGKFKSLSIVNTPFTKYNPLSTVILAKDCFTATFLNSFSGQRAKNLSKWGAHWGSIDSSQFGSVLTEKDVEHRSITKRIISLMLFSLQWKKSRRIKTDFFLMLAF